MDTITYVGLDVHKATVCVERRSRRRRSFIPPGPTRTFDGTPGKANCYGKSVSALVRQFGGLNAAAAASGFSSVKALQNAILAFCGG
jgi:hypothetical protein